MRRLATPVPTRRRRPATAAPLAVTRARALMVAAAALAAALCAASAGSHPLAAQARPAAPAPTPAGSAILAGLIVDMSGRPIPGVQVLLVELGASATTDADGAFVFAGAPAGWYTLVTRRIGFQLAKFEVETRDGATTQVRYRLIGSGQALDTVRVAGAAGVAATHRMAAFEHRRANSVNGTFFTRDDIARLDPRVLTDLLRRASGLRIDDTGLEQFVMARRSVGTLVVASDSTMEARPCPLRLAVDGRMMPPGTPLNIIAPHEIQGVEVYPGPASVPLEFVRTGPDAVCGLVAVWTR